MPDINLATVVPVGFHFVGIVLNLVVGLPGVVSILELPWYNSIYLRSKVVIYNSI
eukprot:SAG11_NODE_20113_length_452_cov_1.232295_1_plen_55_part_00